MKTSIATAVVLGSIPAISGFSLWAEDNDFENGKWDRTLQTGAYVQTIFPFGIGGQFAPAFNDAADFWDGVLGAAPVNPVNFNQNFNVAANTNCDVQFTFPAGSTIVGLSVFAEVSPIDGLGGTLGRAGPCAFTTVGSRIFPRLGTMQFDSADSQNLLNRGTFEDVVRHEMGHVIGIGTLWGTYGLVSNSANDPRYTGVNGRLGQGQLGGGTGTVAVANTGGAGTARAHWREVTFDNELMTGFLNNGVNPASILTVRSLQDLGYAVNQGAAEAYSIPKTGEATGEVIEMSNDIVEFELVDLDQAVKTNEEKASRFTILVAVIGSLLAVMSAMVVFILYNKRKTSAVEDKVEDVTDSVDAKGTVNPMAPEL